MKEIIVNNSKNKRIITVVENTELIEKYEENEEFNRVEGNIYLGKVTNILPGMQAAFIDIGDDKNAFLHIRDLLPKASNETGNKNEDFNKYNIKDYIKIGMPILVEVKKDKTEKKGAKVSSNLNIPGKYVVLIPKCSFITVSQKIEDIDEINRLKTIIKSLNIEDFGFIIRTAATNVSEELIKEDIQNLIKLYNDILSKKEKIIQNKNFEPTVLFDRGNIITRLLLDLGNNDLQRIVVNDINIYENVKKLVESNNLDIKIDLIERENILDLYNIEKQIEKNSNRKVWLKCGGFIIIDRTEALTAIDINTGKFTGKESIEQTILKVNSEATVEIAKQLRIRDIGGIVVIDYIDMDSARDEEEIIKLLEKCLKKDRAKTQVVGFTKLHLLEMTRKHICSSI